MELSIVIPIYNALPFLKDCIESILAQTYKDYELILVDDGSTDGSADICDQYASKYSYVQAYHNKNHGAGYSRNYGIQKASGKFIAFPDADDCLDCHMYQCLVENIKKTNADLVICGFWEKYPDTKKGITWPEHVETDGNIIKENFFEHIDNGYTIVPWNKLYRLDLIKKHHIFFPDWRRCQDAAFNLQYFEYAQSCSYVEDKLYYFKMNTLQTSYKKYPADIFENFYLLIKKYYEAANKWQLDDSMIQGIIGKKCIESINAALSMQFLSQVKISDTAQFLKKICTYAGVKEALKSGKTGSSYQHLLQILLKYHLYVLTALVNNIKYRILLKCLKAKKNV